MISSCALLPYIVQCIWFRHLVVLLITYHSTLVLMILIPITRYSAMKLDGIHDWVTLINSFKLLRNDQLYTYKYLSNPPITLNNHHNMTPWNTMGKNLIDEMLDISSICKIQVNLLSKNSAFLSNLFLFIVLLSGIKINGLCKVSVLSNKFFWNYSDGKEK